MNTNNPNPKNYTFWVETTTGEETHWTHLTKTQARNMFAYTQASTPHNLKRWGWGEAQDLRFADLPLNAAN